MRASSILAASASLLSLAQARIYGIGVPSTIKAGDTFDLIVEAQNYVQTVTDVSIAVGYSAGTYPASEALGTFITAFDLVEDSNTATNYNKSVTLPASVEAGTTFLTASVYSLYGAVAGPTLVPYNVSFTVGDETSTTYVFSA
ncbi:hypothetical protein SLS53_009011 [Cytospora paraplurivora]|uniref:Uncharacterized protein n=1 Tax=Cytospora paraplurivora TaxID=2898453 RepID=A0AAN9YC61_9PEZI